jgi:hypothetical protein
MCWDRRVSNMDGLGDRGSINSKNKCFLFYLTSIHMLDVGTKNKYFVVLSQRGMPLSFM